MSGGGNFQGNQGAGGWSPPAGMPGSSNMGSSSWGGNYGNQTGQRQPGFVSGGPDDPAYGGSGYMGRGGNTIWPGSGNVQNPGMPGNYGWSPSYGYPNGGFGYNNRPPQPWQPPVQNPGMPGGGQYPRYPGGGDTSWNGPMPPGFTRGSGPATMALVEYENPTTGQKWTAPSGGYTAPPGWNIVGGPGAGGGNRIQPGTEGPSLIGGDPDIIGPITEGGWNHNPGLGFTMADRGKKFGRAAQFADQGKFGRAKQAVEQGGGTWSKDMHKHLKYRNLKSRTIIN